MSAPNLNPDDLEIPDLPDNIRESSGPVIDSSDEFPLPAWDFDDMSGADVLFPEGSEPTAEEFPVERSTSVAVASEPVQTPSRQAVSPVSAPSNSVRPLEVELPPLPGDDESLDDDYFQEGLEPEFAQDPGSVPLSTSKAPPDQPLPRVAWDKAGGHFRDKVSAPPPPAPPTVSQHHISLPSVTLDPVDEPEYVGPGRRDSWTLPSNQDLSANTWVGSLASSHSESLADRQSSTPTQPVPMPPAERMFDEPTPSQWADAVQETPVFRANDAPVEEYVRKVAVKRDEQVVKRKVRSWVPIGGCVLLALGYFLSPSLFDKLAVTNLDVPVMVVASSPQGEVFAGETLLGQAPLALNAETAARTDLQIRKAGFLPLSIPALTLESDSPDKIHSFSKPLAAKPVAVTWDGLPKETVIWWNGAKVEVSKLASTKPGRYNVKAKTKDRPPVTFSLKVPAGSDTPFEAGQAVKAAFDKQPRPTVAFKSPDKGSSGKSLTFYVESVGGASKFSREVKGKAGGEASVYLPGPGKYIVIFDGNGDFQSVSKKFEVKPSSTSKVELALSKRPPVSAVSQQPSAPTGQGYSQPTYHQPSYSPPPAYYPSGGGGGGGGGGGRIAPPAF